jgi:predicted nucleic acid-binding protein
VNRVVFDTNVLISAIHFGGKPLGLLQLAIDDEIALFYS